MKKLLFALSCALTASATFAAPVCPQNLLDLKKEAPILAKLKELNPASVQQMQAYKCGPKATGTLVQGAPLCLFDEGAPVSAIAVETLASNSRAVGFLYMIDSPPTNPESVLASLRKRYKEIPASSYPEELKQKIQMVEVVAVFKDGNKYISLKKRPTEGEGNTLTVSYINQKDLKLAFREPDCK